MKTPSGLAPAAAQLNDDQLVPEELVGRLYQADDAAVADVVAGYSPSQRANLAMFFYRKAHLHHIGLAIAATCDRSSLVQAWGRALGQALFDQSRAARMQSIEVPARKPKITLAKLPTFVWILPSLRRRRGCTDRAIFGSRRSCRKPASTPVHGPGQASSGTSAQPGTRRPAPHYVRRTDTIRG